jgi:amino acid transporter
MQKSSYNKNSLTLAGSVAMGTGVMIGAGIFALTGQIAELSGPLFPLAFLIGAVISGFSAYTYIKVSNKYPSAGGIAMILKKSYGPSTITGAAALMMAFSMIINESLVARTFGTYTLQLFNVGRDSVLVPILAIGLIIFAFIVNSLFSGHPGSRSNSPRLHQAKQLPRPALLLASPSPYWLSRVSPQSQIAAARL